MTLVQITSRTLTHDRVPIGQHPVFETELTDDQEIVRFWTSSHGGAHRKTQDHFAIVWVATRLRSDA